MAKYITRKLKHLVVKSVTFRANIPIEGKFQHIHIEASADVPENVRPEDILDELKEFVAKELKRAKEGEVEPAPKVHGRFRI